MRLLSVSRRATGPCALAMTLSLLAAGCASSTPPEVQRLHAEALFEQAQTDFRNHQIGPALSEFRQAVALDDRNPRYHNGLGLLLLNVKRPETITEAVTEFRKALALDDSYAEAHENLGVALAEERKWQEAIDEYRKALALPTFRTPDVAQYNLGWALYNLGRYPEAEEALRLAVRLNPGLAAAHYVLGMVLFKEGRSAEARAAFREAQRVDPKSPFGWAATRYLQALGEGR